MCGRAAVDRVVRCTQAGEPDMALERSNDRQARRCQREDRRGLTDHSLGDVDDAGREHILGWGRGRLRRSDERQRDVREALRVEMGADQVEHPGWTLVGDEPEVHPCARVRRQDGLDPGAAVAGVDAADVAGRGERQPLSERQARQTVNELLDAEELAQLVLNTRALLSDGLARTGARLPDGVVKSLYAYGPVHSADALEGGVQPPRRAGKHSGSARVRIAGERLDIELDREVALETECNLGPTVHGKAAALPEATVGAEQVGVLFDDRVEMRAGDLLFALDDPADRQRQPVAGLAHGADGC